MVKPPDPPTPPPDRDDLSHQRPDPPDPAETARLLRPQPRLRIPARGGTPSPDGLLAHTLLGHRVIK